MGKVDKSVLLVICWFGAVNLLNVQIFYCLWLYHVNGCCFACIQAQKSFERCLHLDPSNREVRSTVGPRLSESCQ